jgi:hypothetical protein
MKNPPRYQTLLDEKGVSLLKDFGITDVALKSQDALLAVDFLREDRVTILGGDVYLQSGTNIELAYANWFTRQRAGEDLSAFMERSCQETENYIKNFPSNAGITPLFALVVSQG